jgi:LuxR family maltose regulon positive regulatory protein
MSRFMIIQNQLLATKFFVPLASHPLIARPRLNALLQESLNRPLTVISTPAGFGKTMLLSAWGKSLSPSDALLGWLSLDEEDNEPVSFWINVITALSTHASELFTPLLKYLQSPQTPPLKHVLAELINLLMDRPEHFALILDDYHCITEPQVHDTLRYLVEHLPPQLHIILATRTDPPLPISLLQTREQVLQIRTDQLSCTAEETKAFLQEVAGVQLSDQTIQEVTTRTEGWLVGLQLLGLSLSGCSDPATILAELSGDQRYIQDFLIEEVLQRQSPAMQSFLLSTCILERFTTSLCDTVMQQAGSQRMLEQLERANLFVVSLDNKRQWYRYHALFAEALRYRLEHTYPNLALTLHHRASLWYAEHNQTTQAILHAFSAHDWQRAADLIEHLPVMSFTWGANEHEKVLLRQWLEQLPEHIRSSRPRLCLACAQMLWTAVSPTKVQTWLDTAEKTLVASLTQHMDEDASDQSLTLQERQSQENLLGEVIGFRAYLLSFQEDGLATLALCQRASSLLSEENVLARVHLALSQMTAHVTSAGNIATATEIVLHGSRLAQKAGYIALAIAAMGATVYCMTTIGQLGEAHRLAQEAIQLGRQSGGLVLPDVGWVMIWHAEILREWNQLDAAHALVEEAIPLCKQTGSFVTAIYLVCGYATLAHICLSSGELERAQFALQEVEKLGRQMSHPIYHYFRSPYTIVDQVRLWLARKDLDRAARWVRERDLLMQLSTPLVHEREEVARVRLLLATSQPIAALQRLEPVLERATAGQRWKHVLEVHLLQALAYQICGQKEQALPALSEAIRIAKPEGYIRSFVDEGPPMAALLSQLREQQQKNGPTPYLDTVLAAFPSQSKARKRQRKQDKVAVH